MQKELSNQERAAIARGAVEAYSARTDSDQQSLEENIIDLLADLRHLMTVEGIDFEKCLTLAGLHHASESPSTYNGWTNYETSIVHLWMTNKHDSYCYCRSQARRHIENAPNTRQVRDGIWDKDRAAVYTLADELHEDLEDSIQFGNPSIFSDLLRAAISNVDWTGIAQALIDAENE